jgi:hypothetical protein
MKSAARMLRLTASAASQFIWPPSSGNAHFE